MGSRLDMGMLEDEDILNIGLWYANATKQWCKFDVPYPWVYKPYLKGSSAELRGCCSYEDPKWYPAGIATVFYTAHGAKDPPETRKILAMYDSQLKRGLPPPIYFNGTFFESGTLLKKAHPTLRCII